MKPGFDLRLMLVTDAAMSVRRGLVATVLEAVAGGVTIVQLRDKTASDAALVATAIALKDALAPTGVPLIVNDRPYVAKAAGLAGVHIGQDDGDPKAARALLGADALIGLSVTRADEIATVDPAVVDYVGLGPVFATGSKADAAPPLGLVATSAIGARLPLPWVAIGGISVENAALITRAGAAGIAVVSAISAAADPRAAAADLRAAIDRGRAMIPNVLAIAGVDPSGGAGVLADIKAISANGAYAMGVVTALTAQNTRGVSGVELVSPEFVARQIDAVFDDIRVDAVKIGMVATAEIARTIAAALRRHNARHVVLDPVMIAKSGDRLLAEDAVAAIRDVLLPLAELITPNLPEAAALLGGAEPTDVAAMREMAKALLALGSRAVLLKGGHLPGPEATDVLADADGIREFTTPRVATKNTHGTGCTLSSAIAALLPVMPRAEAVRSAKAYLTEALTHADELSVGHGHGPVRHFLDR